MGLPGWGRGLPHGRERGAPTSGCFIQYFILSSNTAKCKFPTFSNLLDLLYIRHPFQMHTSLGLPLALAVRAAERSRTTLPFAPLVWPHPIALPSPPSRPAVTRCCSLDTAAGALMPLLHTISHTALPPVRKKPPLARRCAHQPHSADHIIIPLLCPVLPGVSALDPSAPSATSTRISFPADHHTRASERHRNKALLRRTVSTPQGCGSPPPMTTPQGCGWLYRGTDPGAGGVTS